MTKHEPPLPPPPPGYDADETAFASFTRGHRPLADDLHTVTRTNLGAHTTLDDHAFSRVGNDVGLSAAIRNASQSQLDRVHGLAGRTDDMADAVDHTWTNYRELEDEHDRRLRRALGEST
ncbi:hypothetical protein [Actinophytocola sp.]|uniref:hypothetical protein n=1 Tax=Actinophytocola sp. TaxID=1872138 RepID=UPI00389B2431